MATSCSVDFDSPPLSAAAVGSFCRDGGSALMTAGEVHSEGEFGAGFGSEAAFD